MSWKIAEIMRKYCVSRLDLIKSGHLRKDGDVYNLTEKGLTLHKEMFIITLE